MGTCGTRPYLKFLVVGAPLVGVQLRWLVVVVGATPGGKTVGAWWAGGGLVLVGVGGGGLVLVGVGGGGLVLGGVVVGLIGLVLVLVEWVTGCSVKEAQQSC